MWPSPLAAMMLKVGTCSPCTIPSNSAIDLAPPMAHHCSTARGSSSPATRNAKVPVLSSRNTGPCTDSLTTRVSVRTAPAIRTCSSSVRVA